MTEQRPEPPPPAPAKPEGPPPEPREEGRPSPRIETGEWVWAVFWRSFALPGQPKYGTWEKALGRTIGASEKEVCYEASNTSQAQDDAAFLNSNLRWTASERVFRTETAAEKYRAEQPPLN